jgi:predicted kinase
MEGKQVPRYWSPRETDPCRLSPGDLDVMRSGPPARHSIMRVNDPVLLLTGPPGAGKTTTARILATDFELAVHLESDWFFRSIRSGYIEPWKRESHQQNVTVMRIVAAAAAGYAEAGYFTIVDGIISPNWFLAPLHEALKAAGHAVAYAVLRPSLATCRSRMTDRTSGEVADISVVEQLWREFSKLGPLEGHAIDNDDSSPATTAEEILLRLREGQLVV